MFIRPPNTCLQYLEGTTGRIETFNYQNAGENHLANQKFVPPQRSKLCMALNTIAAILKRTTAWWLYIRVSIPVCSYAVCIRAEEGFCCIQYMVCPDEAATVAPQPGFSISSMVDGTALTDDDCLTLDYISINDSCTYTSTIWANVCNTTKLVILLFSWDVSLTDLYCGRCPVQQLLRRISRHCHAGGKWSHLWYVEYYP